MHEMRGWFLRVLTAFLIIAPLPALLAQTLLRVQVNGVPVRVYGKPDQGFVVTAGDQIAIRDDTDMTVGIFGVFEGDGHYVLVSENCGGSGCSDVYQAIALCDEPGVRLWWAELQTRSAGWRFGHRARARRQEGQFHLQL